MLNALRHQRFRHDCAKSARRSSESAQRLTASKVPAQLSGQQQSGGPPVLNALRHQRFRHQFSRTNITTGNSVLNALRHQRFRHSTALNRPKDQEKVLNALRHQRFRHLQIELYKIYAVSAQRLTASKVPAQRGLKPSLCKAFRNIIQAHFPPSKKYT